MLIKGRNFAFLVFAISLITIVFVGATISYMVKIEEELKTMGIGVAQTRDSEKQKMSLAINETFLKSFLAPMNNPNSQYTEYILGEILPDYLTSKDIYAENIVMTDAYVRLNFYSDTDCKNPLNATQLDNIYGIKINNDWVNPTGDNTTFYYFDNRKEDNLKILIRDCAVPVAKQMDKLERQCQLYTKQIGEKYLYTMRVEKYSAEDKGGKAGVVMVQIVAEAILPRTVTSQVLSTNDVGGDLSKEDMALRGETRR